MTQAVRKVFPEIPLLPRPDGRFDLALFDTARPHCQGALAFPMGSEQDL